MLFDLTHTLYIIISLLVTFLLLFLAHKNIHQQKSRLKFLKFFAIITFVLHISIMWTTYLENDSNAGDAYDNILFPIFFCNLTMYTLLITAFLDINSQGFRILATFTAWGGIFGSLISLFYPEYYLHNPNILAWPVLKSLLSHSTMLIGSAYLLVGKFVKIEYKNLLDYLYGLLGCLVLGLFINTFLGFFGKDVNAMYLKRPPLAEAAFLNFLTIPLIMLLVIYLVILVKNKLFSHKKISEIKGDNNGSN